MASSKLVCHIDEHFCQCAICLKPFLEPKLLPCLHRFCKECLRPLFANLSEGDIFCCPVCRAESTIPAGGFEALKYDFLVCELTKVIQWRKSVQNETQIRRCEGCTKEEESAGFCSKCVRGFLCQNCFSFHQTFSTSMLKDHPPVIELKDVMSGKVKISMDILSQFNAAPRCQNHPENILRLSCVTCKGQQICIACTYEDHVEHRAEAVRIVAGMQRDDLQKKIDELKLMMTDWESNYQMLTTIKEKLSFAVKEVTGRVRSITETKLEKLKEERENDMLTNDKKINELKESGILEKARLENAKNEKIREVERQYDELLQKLDADINCKIEEVIEDDTIRLDELDMQMFQLKAHSEDMIKAVSNQLHNQNLSIEKLMADMSSTQKRFENFICTGSNILSYTNDWLAVETIPNLRLAHDGIKDDIGKIKATLSELEDEIILRIPTVSESAKPGEVGFIEREKYLTSSTDLVSMDDENFFPLEYVDRMVFIKSCDCIAMSGNLRIDYSTAVINTTMEGTDREYLKRFDDCSSEKPYCLICQIDQDVIATACDKNLGIINVTKSTYNGLTLDDEESLTGICADQTLKQILTHQGNDGIVKVYDLNLDLVKTRELPNSISPSCMIVHDNKLIVGGQGESNIYVLNEDDEILGVISPPGLQREEGEEWDCLDLCCSRDGTLFALWRKSIDSETAESGGYIVVYTPRYYPLEIIPTSSEATCLTLMEKYITKNVMTSSQTALYMYKVWNS